MDARGTADVYEPARWGLPEEAIADLGNRLHRVWSRFRACFKTKTRDGSEHAWTYLRGLVGMGSKRNYANIARRVMGPEEDGQNVQQFMTDSPWSAQLERVRVRSSERGELDDPFAMRRVWTVREGELAEEWLVTRHEYGQRYSYALSNAPADASREHLAWLKCVRHFVERANQEAKSETGWDELQAQKYRAWEHHLAMTILATWFIAETKHEWALTYRRDPELAQQLELDMLPALSVANVRELLQATMPLPQLSPDQATRLVVKHLVNRSRSTRSRLRAQHKARAPS